MMMEPLDNMGPSSGKKPDPCWMRKHREFFLDKHVKLEFPATPRACRNVKEGSKELMWVRVWKVSNEAGCELEGIVMNDPVHALDYPCGTIVGFSRNEIIEVLAKEGRGWKEIDPNA